MDPKLQERLIGALTFKVGVYDDVESDASFTQTAWIIVVVASFLNQLGANRTNIIGAIIGTIIAVVLFYVLVIIVSWVGRSVFHATVDNNELVRTIGLANVWNVVGILAIIPGIGPLIGFITGLLYFVAALLATKASLDLEWVQTIVTLLVAFIVYFVIFAIIVSILAIFGIGAAIAGGLLG